MNANITFDVEIRDMARYQDFVKSVKPALDAAGTRYLARGEAYKAYEGDWQPRRIVILDVSIDCNLGGVLQRAGLSRAQGYAR
jgi:uncharacterized protein (DUF1330 family)